MLPEDGTHEYIQFLRRRGSITHIVSGQPGGKISTLALTQRCLANGISCPVPLPDGTVGINAPEGVPAALAGPEVSVEPLASTVEPELQEPTKPSLPLARLQAIDAKLGKLETALSEDKQVPKSDTNTSPQEVDVPPPSSSLIEENAHLEEPVVEDTVEETDLVDPAASPVADAEIDHDLVHSEDGIQEAPMPEDASLESNGRAETPIFTEQKTEERLSEQFTKMCEDISKLNNSISEVQSAMESRLDTIESAISQGAQKPLPRPDTSQFNSSIAKMMTAFAAGLRRLETVADNIERQPPEMTEEQGRSDDPLRTLAALQKTMALQVASLLEGHQASKTPEIKELLADVRLAIAELSESNSQFEKAS